MLEKKKQQNKPPFAINTGLLFKTLLSACAGLPLQCNGTKLTFKTVATTASSGLKKRFSYKNKKVYCKKRKKEKKSPTVSSVYLFPLSLAKDILWAPSEWVSLWDRGKSAIRQFCSPSQDKSQALNAKRPGWKPGTQAEQYSCIFFFIIIQKESQVI